MKKVLILLLLIVSACGHQKQVNHQALPALPVERLDERSFNIESTRSYNRFISTSTTIKQAPKPTTSSSVPPKPVITTTTVPAKIQAAASSTSGLPAGLLCIRHKESTDNYSDNTGNGYYGAYQYLISTWNHYKGFARADLAPPAIQDERALADYNLGPAHRHGEWPKSSRLCGV